MSDKIENLSIEKSNWSWAEKKVDTYKDVLKGQEFGKKETEADRQKADELLQKMEGLEKSEKISQQKNEKKTETSPLPQDIKKEINNLNRPEAQKGIEQAYTNIDTTIKNSKNDKNRFARQTGKIMNRILGDQNAA